MPSKDYRMWLSDQAYLVVAFVMVKGEVVSFVVRLMLMQDGGRQVNVARYDTATVPRTVTCWGSDEACSKRPGF